MGHVAVIRSGVLGDVVLTSSMAKALKKNQHRVTLVTSLAYRVLGEAMPGSAKRTLVQPVPCRPCSNPGNSHVPLKHHRCLQDLDVDEVCATAVDMLRLQGQS